MLRREFAWLGGLALGLTVGLWLWRVGVPPTGDLVGGLVEAASAGVGLALVVRAGELVVDAVSGAGGDVE